MRRQGAGRSRTHSNHVTRVGGRAGSPARTDRGHRSEQRCPDSRSRSSCRLLRTRRDAAWQAPTPASRLRDRLPNPSCASPSVRATDQRARLTSSRSRPLSTPYGRTLCFGRRNPAFGSFIRGLEAGSQARKSNIMYTGDTNYFVPNTLRYCYTCMQVRHRSSEGDMDTSALLRFLHSDRHVAASCGDRQALAATALPSTY